MMGTQSSPVKSYDYLLKFLLVGDSDVGKGEILESLQDGSVESPYAYSSGEYTSVLCSVVYVLLEGPGLTNTNRLCVIAGIDYKTTTILLDGRRVKLELWYVFLGLNWKCVVAVCNEQTGFILACV